MRAPRQSPPVERSRRGGGAAAGGVTPSEWQCWTEPACAGLAFQYGANLAACCGLGARSARGIGNDQGQGCHNCP